MLRKLLILGICAGTSASVPILYQSNTEAFHGFVERWTGDAPDPEKVSAVPANRPVAKAEPEALLGKKVRLAADSRGHFTAEFKLNGRRIEALVDTGATLVAINMSTARRIGITLSPEDFKYKVDTANGSTRAATAVIDNLQIGRIFVEDVQAVVLDDAALGNTLIGMSFLKRLNKFQIQNDGLLLVQ